MKLTRQDCQVVAAHIGRDIQLGPVGVPIRSRYHDFTSWGEIMGVVKDARLERECVAQERKVWGQVLTFD